MKFAVLLTFFWSLNVALAVTVITFSGEHAEGDSYADGTPLLAGECYAVVYQASAADFKGFKADGTAYDPEHCEILAILSGSKFGAQRDVRDGRIYAFCPPCRIQIPKPVVNLYENQLYLYVFDTRIWKDGALALGELNDSGLPSVINGYSCIMRLSYKTDNDDTPPPPQEYVNRNLTATVATVPEDLPEPRFSSVCRSNDCLFISVTNAPICFAYGLSATNALSLVNSTTNYVGRNELRPGDFKQGRGASPLVWEVPARESTSMFYRIQRVPRP